MTEREGIQKKGRKGGTGRTYRSNNRNNLKIDPEEEKDSVTQWTRREAVIIAKKWVLQF